MAVPRFGRDRRSSPRIPYSQHPEPGGRSTYSPPGPQTSSLPALASDSCTHGAPGRPPLTLGGPMTCVTYRPEEGSSA